MRQQPVHLVICREFPRTITPCLSIAACPALGSLVWHLLWIATLVAAVVLSRSQSALACSEPSTDVFLASIAIAAVFAATDACVVVFASAGTVSNPRPRASVPAWFTARLAGAVVELGAVSAALAATFAPGVSGVRTSLESRFFVTRCA